MKLPRHEIICLPGYGYKHPALLRKSWVHTQRPSAQAGCSSYLGRGRPLSFRGWTVIRALS